ncbi:TetR/AcrR family transcriptional regulator [Micromonospora thermarum]|uniref:TetR/AcrR family transcriptional regulator n=1 Tax=Micromonospora thermarum TaxID=2720024 RepID=UPI00197C7255|nr:TetR/AcrR family transcriptional regulator [Micromonospora thermarum]
MDTDRRRLRADAERSIRTIIEAAERMLTENPAATIEQIAESAGVARTTVHRRFASREALITSMTRAAWNQIAAAVAAARPATAPPLVALHQATANILNIKSRWRFALGQPTDDAATGEIQQEVFAACDLVLQRAQQTGLIHPDADLAWARRVYLALINETMHGTPPPHGDSDTLATRILDTLLHGIGPTAPA